MDRTVENVLTALVEVCGTILTQEGIAVESYAEALGRSGKLFGFTHEEEQRLEKLAIQRNRLAHRYLDFRWQAVSLFSRERPLVHRLLTAILSREEENNGSFPGTGPRS